MSVNGVNMSSRFRNKSSACSRSCRAGAPQYLSIGLGFEKAIKATGNWYSFIDRECVDFLDQ